MTRVLMALPGLHRVGRGAEIAFEAIAAQLAVRPGFEVTLIGSGYANGHAAKYRFLHAGCVARERFEQWPKLPPVRSAYAYEELTFLPGLLGAYRPGEFDVTVTCAYPFTNWALRARSSGGRRPAHVFVTQNGDWPARRQNAEYRWFGCDGLVCTNPEYLERHRARWRCTMIPNGVDAEVFRPGPAAREQFGLPADRPVVLLVGALIPSKRVLEGVRAAGAVPGAFVAVAGDGPLRADVDRLLGELGPERAVRLSLPRERMPDLYRSADVLLHMSADEPFGNIYTEAMASGLPIVAHDTPGTRWITSGHATLLDTGDLGAVTDALRAALREPAMSDAALGRDEAVRRFSWPVVADAYAAFLSDVAARAEP